MTIQELKDLLQEIRDGRNEGETVNWKRKFWSLDIPESRREFLKDITAMANSLASPYEERRIVLGIRPDGMLVNNPLPCDESQVRHVLDAITADPSVRFNTFTIEGKQISVVEIHPPFDRPYVAKVNNDHFIWVRLGSSTVTANRKMLDRFYLSQQRSPSLEVKWINWGSVLTEEGTIANESDVLVLPAPICSLDDLLQAFEQLRIEARKKAAKKK